jgi:transposase
VATPPSGLSVKVTEAYWKKVRGILKSRHRLSPAEATRAVKAYRAALAADGVGDEIYHAPVEDTARGISRGCYTQEQQPQVRVASQPQ